MWVGTMRRLLTLIFGLLPAGRCKNRVLRSLGHSIHPTASLGPILILGRSRLQLGERARIGPFNVVRNVSLLAMDSHSEIGQWNWISAAPFLLEGADSLLAGNFKLGSHSSITSRHYFDASGGIDVEEFVTIAGVRSVFMSHGIDVQDGVLDVAPISVRRYSMVGGSCSFVLGATVPEYSVVAMGSVVTAGLTEPDSLYAGVPAKFKKILPRGKYATRTSGPVLPRRMAS